MNELMKESWKKKVQSIASLALRDSLNPLLIFFVALTWFAEPRYFDNSFKLALVALVSILIILFSLFTISLGARLLVSGLKKLINTITQQNDKEKIEH